MTKKQKEEKIKSLSISRLMKFLIKFGEKYPNVDLSILSDFLNYVAEHRSDNL